MEAGAQKIKRYTNLENKRFRTMYKGSVVKKNKIFSAYKYTKPYVITIEGMKTITAVYLEQSEHHK